MLSWSACGYLSQVLTGCPRSAKCRGTVNRLRVLTDIPRRLLHREGVRVCHVPNVALASYNSTVSMLTAKAAKQSTNEVRPDQCKATANRLFSSATHWGGHPGVLDFCM